MEPADRTIYSKAGLVSPAKADGHGTLQGWLDNQTDQEVVIICNDDGITVLHYGTGGQPGQWTFTYPFDVHDAVAWVYHFEIDNSTRFEFLSDIGEMLHLTVREDEASGLSEDAIEQLIRDRSDSVEQFMSVLLWDRYINLDGSDLMLASPDGGAVELSACFVWTDSYRGDMLRPFQPDPHGRCVAKLHSDGRLALAWPADSAFEGEPGRRERVLPDLVVVDLTSSDLDTSLAVYDSAYHEYWRQD